jgi:SAM-dependent methyltransferase
MQIEEFFKLFLEELKINKNLWNLYKFLDTDNPSVFEFRKNYFIQRLTYIKNSITKENASIWDCGCGYGSTAIFLVLNGYKVYGNTLEFYTAQMPSRLQYWSKYGNLENLKIDHLNLYEMNINTKYDYIIAQDTLHHLEPINEALKMIHDALKDDGKLISVEVNGHNIIERLRYYKQRGNNKIIEVYDERLGKNILMGNENVRSLKTWSDLMEKQSLKVVDSSVEYIRMYFPSAYRIIGFDKVVTKESRIWKNNAFLKNYFFFGLNFLTEKKSK